MLLFMALQYYVHKQQEEELEANIVRAKKSFHGSAVRHQQEHPGHPVYLTVTVRAEDYSRYFPFVGWTPEAPTLGIWRVEMTETLVPEPVVKVDDHSLDILRPGKTTYITYSEPLLP